MEVQDEIHGQWKARDAPRISVASTSNQTLGGHEPRFNCTSELDVCGKITQGTLTYYYLSYSNFITYIYIFKLSFF